MFETLRKTLTGLTAAAALTAIAAPAAMAQRRACSTTCWRAAN